MVDYNGLFDIHDAKQCRAEQEWRRTLPVCEYCGEPIEDDMYYAVDGVFFHKSDKECEKAAFEAIVDMYRDKHLRVV